MRENTCKPRGAITAGWLPKLFTCVFVGGLMMASTAHAALGISKQLHVPITQEADGSFTMAFYLRIVSDDEDEVSNIEVRDTVKQDFEGGSTNVQVTLAQAPVFYDWAGGNETTTNSGTLHSGFLTGTDNTILSAATLPAGGGTTIVRYQVNVKFVDDPGPLATNSEVGINDGGFDSRDISNHGEKPDLLNLEDDSATTLFLPKFAAADLYTSLCAGEDVDFDESQLNHIVNSGFTTDNGTPGQLEPPVAAGQPLADGSFTSGADYAGDDAYPADGGANTAGQISIRTNIGLHSNNVQQHPFPGDANRSYVAATNNWLFYNGNKSGNPVDVWKQTVRNLQKDQPYNFTVYVSNAAWPGFNSSEHPQIELQAGGSVLPLTVAGDAGGNDYTVPVDDQTDDWRLLEAVYTPVEDGDVELKIVNNQTGAYLNNLALTSIGLRTCAVQMDTDGDGLNDDIEVFLGTDKDLEDTDGDGANDNIEVGDPLNPPDADGDGKINALESSTADADGDGDVDQADANDSDGPLGDIDNDGLTNAQEAALGTDPDMADTDADGADDLTEVGSDVTSPLDNDGDGKIDALESSTVDVDGDGDFDQADGNDNDGPLGDADNDGLTNAQEAALGTDPDIADTDADGTDDLIEVGSDIANPLDSDGDGKIDALESSLSDVDGDSSVDQAVAGDSDGPPANNDGGSGGGSIGFGFITLMALLFIRRYRQR